MGAELAEIEALYRRSYPRYRNALATVTGSGSTTMGDAATVDVHLEDGNVATVPVVWVSAPIDAGFFG